MRSGSGSDLTISPFEVVMFVVPLLKPTRRNEGALISAEKHKHGRIISRFPSD
jgi:hypothetical protein